jgi:lysophospholipase L1-like esterase
MLGVGCGIGLGLQRPKLRELWVVSACVQSIKALLIAATTTAVLCGSPALSATTHRHAAVALGRPSGSRTSYYLALGDSVPVWNGNSSYPYLILAHYQRKLPGLRLDDMAVSGATTGTMRLGGQYLAARSFLRAHRGHIALITIDIGGNDIAGCVGPGGIDPACSAQARSTIKRNLTAMLAGLHAAARGVRVIGMTYYNPFLGDWLAGGPLRSLAISTLPGLVSLNRELTALYSGAKKTADVQGMFRSTDLKTVVASQWGDVPIAVKRACSWLDIQCHVGAPQGFGDDPNNAGAAAIASAFERTIGPLLYPQTFSRR